MTNPALFMGPECLPAWLEERLGQANGESRQQGRWGGSKGGPAMAALSPILISCGEPRGNDGQRRKET